MAEKKSKQADEPAVEATANGEPVAVEAPKEPPRRAAAPKPAPVRAGGHRIGEHGWEPEKK